jgi:predicted N-acetyltransferase YhbS
MENIIIRKALSENDSIQLKELLNNVFNPEKVGDLAETFFHHLPGINNNFWFLAEDRNSNKLVSSFTLIPWIWEYEGVQLKVAEMGLVGTDENYRGQGLMKLLNKEFDKTLEKESFDLGVIQGIPGFYHKFGYYYAIALENHINLPLEAIPDETSNDFNFRLATEKDIPFLMHQDEIYKSKYTVTVKRNESNWMYILSHGKTTDYGSEIWIMEDINRVSRYYFRIQFQGFANGLILSETSENINTMDIYKMFTFCKKLAIDRSKPYIRLNLHNQSSTGKQAISLGAKDCLTYGWQIKIQNKLGFLKKITPVIEKRLSNSSYCQYTGKLRLDFYQETIDISIKEGKLTAIEKGDYTSCINIFCIANDLFPSLVLGHRSWKEIQYIRPDIFPEHLYTNPFAGAINISGELIDIIFPKNISWVYLQY